MLHCFLPSHYYFPFYFHPSISTPWSGQSEVITCSIEQAPSKTPTYRFLFDLDNKIKVEPKKAINNNYNCTLCCAGRKIRLFTSMNV